jgi:hypothetical protein
VTCTLRYTFQLTPCGRPAAFAIKGTESRVCRECMPVLAHMPRRLFVGVSK